MRISKESIRVVKHTKNVIKMIPVCSVITDAKPRVIEDFENTVGGEWMTGSVDEDASSIFATKIRKYALPISDTMSLFFGTLEKFEDEWWGVYQVRYAVDSEPHAHLLWQSLMGLITKNETLDSPLEMHFEFPRCSDKQRVKDLFTKIFDSVDTRGDYTLHVVGE